MQRRRVPSPQTPTASGRTWTRIDAFYYCPHDKNQCDYRNPKPGLFHQTFRDQFEAPLANNLVIGDSLSDIEGADNLGMLGIFIEGDPNSKPGATAIALSDAVT